MGIVVPLLIDFVAGLQETPRGGAERSTVNGAHSRSSAGRGLLENRSLWRRIARHNLESSTLTVMMNWQSGLPSAGR